MEVLLVWSIGGEDGSASRAQVAANQDDGRGSGSLAATNAMKRRGGCSSATPPLGAAPLSQSVRAVRYKRSTAHTIPSLLASTMTLNNSPISAGDSRRCTAAASRRYARRRRLAHGRKASRMPAPTQEGGQRRVARDREPAALPGQRHRGEIDVRGEVGQSRPQERIGVRAMAIVSHQASRRALRDGSTRPAESRSRSDTIAPLGIRRASVSTSASAAGLISLA